MKQKVIKVTRKFFNEKVIKVTRRFYHENQEALKTIGVIFLFIICLVFTGYVTFKLSKPENYSKEEITMYRNVAQKIREEGLNSINKEDLNSISILDISIPEDEISIRKRTDSIREEYTLAFSGTDLNMEVQTATSWVNCIFLTVLSSILFGYLMYFIIYFIIKYILTPIVSLIKSYIYYFKNYNEEP